MRTRVTALAITMCALLALCSVASAEPVTRYVSGAPGTPASGECTPAMKCTLEWAVNTKAKDGDTVLLDTTINDNYTTSGTLAVTKSDLTIKPANPAGSALVQGAGGGKIIDITGSRLHLERFSIFGTGTGSNYPVHIAAGATGTDFQQVKIQAALSSSAVALFAEGDLTMSDSFVSDAGNNVFAIGVGVSSTTRLYNVTAFETGTGSAAIDLAGTVFAHNTVFSDDASGTSYDVLIQDLGPDPSLHSDYSNYSSISVFSPALVTRGAGDQTDAPNLSSFGGVNAGSPLIDHGSVANLIRNPQFDIMGGARCQGAAPDIGAAESLGLRCGQKLVDGTDRTAPSISGLKAKKKKGKLKTFDFSSSEGGTATFAFTKKKGKKYKKAGSQMKAVIAGKDSIKPKKLKRGKYKLTLTVKDAAGNVSAAKKLSFTVK